MVRGYGQIEHMIKPKKYAAWEDWIKKWIGKNYDYLMSYLNTIMEEKDLENSMFFESRL